MFCTNCGREIIDTAKFCNFCGSPIQNAAVRQPVQLFPTQTENSVQAVGNVQETEKNIVQNASEDPIQNETVPESSELETETPTESESVSEISAPVSGIPAEAPAENNSAPAGPLPQIPTPNTIPSYGVGANRTAYPVINTGVPSSPVIASEPKQTPPPERRYTLGHIMMCLAAVAVMAIVAGVFMGLYFSVV